MKRILTTLLVLLTLACDEAESSPAPSRVVAVASSEGRGEGVESFCEVSGPSAPAFSLPDGAETSAEGWRWVNVWATWCRPCIEEMPRIAAFRERLAADGVDVTSEFINADSNDEAFAAFIEEHGSPGGGRVTSTEALQSWLLARGLDEGAPLPVHFFVRPDGSLACARTAAIGDDDYASVRRLLRDE